MRGRILSLRWRKLMTIGFVVNNRLICLRDLGSSLSAFLRHPAALVVLGFALTGVIGNYLAYLQNERQRQNDETVKSMDQVRAAFDALSESFSDFQFRANRLIALEESGASPDAIAAARKPYDEAVQKWKERLAANSPKIGDDYFQTTPLSNMGLAVTYMDMDTDAVDECLTRNVRKVSSPIDISLDCKNTYAMTPDMTIPEVSVESRMFILSQCVRYFTIFMRPSPQADFQDRSALKDNPAARVIGIVCDPQQEYKSLQHMTEELQKELKRAEVPASTVPTAH